MLMIDKIEGETCSRQIDIVLSESDMEIFGGSLIFEIMRSRYSQIAIFEGFGEVSNYKVWGRNP